MEMWCDEWPSGCRWKWKNNLLPLRRDIGLSFKQSQQQLQDYHPSSITPQPQGQQQNGRTILLNNQRTKPRSLPNSTLDHANQNGFHIPSPEIRTPKALSRTSNIDIKKQLSPKINAVKPMEGR
ncbi:unnamed protein product [Didymodactylos carnosus]|uniref:Uncharacterized protein n=1 Tax=Didymodactylos carnosus TaxID=1234261 RepID=A0A8S2E5J4_9BILA|nr:unnamed protein product [Didymodactylos carnosus]CAF3820548.1 unnamed protein product [Didymodactylos carnosus]